MRNPCNPFRVAGRGNYGYIRDDDLVDFQGPMGFGGGQLAAFWTPADGSFLLGRRMGMNKKTKKGLAFQTGFIL